MAVLYANRIIERADWTENRFIIDDVPNLWREKTITELANRGYDPYGKPLAQSA